MGEFKLQYESKSRKCIYCWDEVNETWLTVAKTNKLPNDVIEQIKWDEEKAKLLLKTKGKYRNEN